MDTAKLKQNDRKKNLKRPASTDSQSSQTCEETFESLCKSSSLAIQSGDFRHAVELYSEALTLNPSNYIVYGNRSAAWLRLGQYQKALEDARRAKELKPDWVRAYIREATALQSLGRSTESLVSYATGLSQEPNNEQLLKAFTTIALQSKIKDRLVALVPQLHKVQLDRSAFVLLSVVGQELLVQGDAPLAVAILEAALRVGTVSLKLRGSVFSALSSAHWILGNLDKAIACMEQDLTIAKNLGDQEGECRADGNLGSAYFSRGNNRQSILHYRSQLTSAVRLKDLTTAATSLSHIGHVYTCTGDYTNALASHLQAVRLIKQSPSADILSEAREIGNVGAVYLALGDVDKAWECHKEHLKLARSLANKREEARAFSNMGSVAHYQRKFPMAVDYHQQVLSIAMSLQDPALESRAYAGLGHAARCMSDLLLANTYHQKQLDLALLTRDRVSQARAVSNLGIICQQLGEYDTALKLHSAALNIAKDLGDRASQGRAYGNIGNAYSAMGQHEYAVRFHKHQLAVSKEVADRPAEAATNGNLGVAYQALGLWESALEHFQQHLHLAKMLHDAQGESRALHNIGNLYLSRQQYGLAKPLYQQYLALCQELNDSDAENRACHKLGYVHYCLGNLRQSLRYYQQSLELSQQQPGGTNTWLCRAHCQLGLVYKAMGDYPQALQCQQAFLQAAAGNPKDIFLALGNVGEVLLRMDGRVDEALGVFTKQAEVARGSPVLQAVAAGNLGVVHRLMGQLDRALAYHNQELTLYQEHCDSSAGECKAHCHLGNVHMSLGNYLAAIRSYHDMLTKGTELGKVDVQAYAYGNLGLAHMNLLHYDEAVALFEQQLSLLQQLPNTPATQLDRARAHGNLTECIEALGDHESAVVEYEHHLALAQAAQSLGEQERAYRGLGNAHKALGQLQQALVCFEKRLVLTHTLDRPAAKCAAYGELGCLHSLVGNFEQANRCLSQQLEIAKEMGDLVAEGEAVCGLGGVSQQMGEYDKALRYHKRDLEIATQISNTSLQCRAYSNLGLANESLGHYDEAIECQEAYLQLAEDTNDKTSCTLAYASLGRIHQAKGNYSQAIHYLHQGLGLAQQCPEDEARLRHRLGLALWGQGELEGARDQLYLTTQLFENIRRDTQHSRDYQVQLFDMQTTSYQVLQRVLVSLGDFKEALVVAERGRTRAFVDYLLERQKETNQVMDINLDFIIDTVAKQQAAILYYSIAAGYIYTWLITPGQGIIKFHSGSVSDLEAGSDPEDCQSVRSGVSLVPSVLDAIIAQVREGLGVEPHSSNNLLMSETESEAEDLWQQQLDALGQRLNADSDKTGFLRLVNRSHLWNASSYSLSSLASSSATLQAQGSIRSSHLSISSAGGGTLPKSASSLSAGSLYDLLIAPIEESLSCCGCRQLVLVLEGDLYLVPFTLLRSSALQPFLYERFHLISAPSIHSLAHPAQSSQTCSGALCLGNPALPLPVVEHWQWGGIAGADQELHLVSELLACRKVVGRDLSKSLFLSETPDAEILHIVTHVSWKLAALVLGAGPEGGRKGVVGGDDPVFDPGLTDILLTAADILNIKLVAKLVVLNSSHSEDRSGRVTSDGVVGLTRALLAAGAQCIVYCLWPVPALASSVFLKAFYTCLLRGARTSQALAEGMQAVQSSRALSHPSNWAGWAAVGHDVRLRSKGLQMSGAIIELLRQPDTAREAMRVALHLVEKSIQRLERNQRKAMYTTVSSIENRVGPVDGWRQLLTAVGFRFEDSTDNLPAAVFFPTCDPGDRLLQCSASLQALLGLPVPTLAALSKLATKDSVAGRALMEVMWGVYDRYTKGEANVLVSVAVQLWQTDGCHELLSSLGFDLTEVGGAEVTICAGKQSSRRSLQFVLQALIALFDPDSASFSVLDPASSMESLGSSCTHSSNFSKGSTPPSSPLNDLRSGKTRSLISQSSGSIKKSSNHTPDDSLQLSRQDDDIRKKFSNPGSDTTTRPRDHAETPDKPALPRNYPEPPTKHPYSTSASEGEEEKAWSRGTQLQDSTKSSNSSSGQFKRNKVSRGSVTSTRSSASDRTLTNDHEEYKLDSAVPTAAAPELPAVPPTAHPTYRSRTTTDHPSVSTQAAYRSRPLVVNTLTDESTTVVRGQLDTVGRLDNRLDSGGRLDSRLDSGGRLDNRLDSGGRLNNRLDSGGCLDSRLDSGGRLDNRLDSVGRLNPCTGGLATIPESDSVTNTPQLTRGPIKTVTFKDDLESSGLSDDSSSVWSRSPASQGLSHGHATQAYVVSPRYSGTPPYPPYIPPSPTTPPYRPPSPGDTPPVLPPRTYPRFAVDHAFAQRVPISSLVRRQASSSILLSSSLESVHSYQGAFAGMPSGCVLQSPTAQLQLRAKLQPFLYSDSDTSLYSSADEAAQYYSLIQAADKQHRNYHPSTQAGYHPSTQAGYHPSTQAGYHPSTQAGYHPSTQAGYPTYPANTKLYPPTYSPIYPIDPLISSPIYGDQPLLQSLTPPTAPAISQAMAPPTNHVQYGAQPINTLLQSLAPPTHPVQEMAPPRVAYVQPHVTRFRLDSASAAAALQVTSSTLPRPPRHLAPADDVAVEYTDQSGEEDPVYGARRYPTTGTATGNASQRTPQRVVAISHGSMGNLQKLPGNHQGLPGNHRLPGNPQGLPGNPQGLPGNPQGLPGNPQGLNSLGVSMTNTRPIKIHENAQGTGVNSTTHAIPNHTLPTYSQASSFINTPGFRQLPTVGGANGMSRPPVAGTIGRTHPSIGTICPPVGGASEVAHPPFAGFSGMTSPPGDGISLTRPQGAGTTIQSPAISSQAVLQPTNDSARTVSIQL